MKIICKTNIDSYKGTIQNCFPDHLTFVPRVGESVLVKESFIKHFESKGLPTKLDVEYVYYTEDTVNIWLGFSKLDLERAKVNNVNLYIL